MIQNTIKLLRIISQGKMWRTVKFFGLEILYLLGVRSEYHKGIKHMWSKRTIVLCESIGLTPGLLFFLVRVYLLRIVLGLIIGITLYYTIVTWLYLVYSVAGIVYAIYLLIQHYQQIAKNKEDNIKNSWLLKWIYEYKIINLNLAPIVGLLHIIREGGFNTVNTFVLGTLLLLITNVTVTSQPFIKLIIRMEKGILNLFTLLNNKKDYIYSPPLNNEVNKVELKNRYEIIKHLNKNRRVMSYGLKQYSSVIRPLRPLIKEFSSTSLNYVGRGFSWKFKFVWPILFIGVYLVLSFFSKTIYLDSDKVDVILAMDNVGIKVSGALIQQIADNYGSVAAFASGLKVGKAIALKTNLHPISKVGTTLSTGALSVLTWKMLEVEGKAFQSTIKVNQIGDSSIHIDIGEIKLFGGDKVNLQNEFIKNKLSECFNVITRQMNVSETSFSSENFQLEAVEKVQLVSKYKIKVADLVDRSIFYNQILTSSKITSLEEGLVVKNTDIFINSPLEDPWVITNEGYNYLVSLTQYSFLINLIIAHLILSVLFIFIVRYVINTESLIEKINNNNFIPNWLKLILTQPIKAWTYTSKYWIIFLLIACLVGSLACASGMYTCLYILSQFGQQN